MDCHAEEATCRYEQEACGTKTFHRVCTAVTFNVTHNSSVMQTKRDDQNTVVYDVRRRASKRRVVGTSQKP